MAAVVRAAVPDDIETIQAIAVAAGQRFSSVADPRVAVRSDDEPFSADDLQGWIDVGRSWVAVEGTPVGFVVVDVVDGNAHVDEISVLPGHQGRGHGATLLDAAAAWARDQRMSAVTLTTFRDVEWNRPYYERRGFVVVGSEAIGPQLAARVAEEDRVGLPTEIRVCMSRTL